MSRLVIYLLIGFCSCNNKANYSGIFLPGNPLPGKMDNLGIINWMKDPDNGYYKEKQIGEYVFSMQVQTDDYIISQELRQRGSKRFDLLKARSELSGMDYFSFCIKAKQDNSPSPNHSQFMLSETQLNYAMFNIQKDFFIVAGADTLECMLSHCEPNLFHNSEIKFSLAFPEFHNNMVPKTFIYHDRLFEYGNIKFLFSETEQSPQLKT